jgi:hypothetical protein
MNRSDIESFVGLPYEADTFDCADLAIDIQDKLFGKTVVLPGRRQRVNAPAAAINRYAQALAKPIPQEELRDGDVVVIQGEPMHIGTIFFISGMAWVLHTTTTLGHSILHRLADLRGYGMRVEGYYQWN